MGFLENTIFGKTFGEWFHYIPLLGTIVLYLNFRPVSIFAIRGFLEVLAVLIIADIVWEKIFIKGDKN